MEEREKNEQVYWWRRERKMNKFIDPEETKKWTRLLILKKQKNSLLILKRQKNEQVDWSWREKTLRDQNIQNIHAISYSTLAACRRIGPTQSSLSISLEKRHRIMYRTTGYKHKQAYLGIWDLRPKEQDSGAVAFQWLHAKSSGKNQLKAKTHYCSKQPCEWNVIL